MASLQTFIMYTRLPNVNQIDSVGIGANITK